MQCFSIYCCPEYLRMEADSGRHGGAAVSTIASQQGEPCVSSLEKCRWRKWLLYNDCTHECASRAVLFHMLGVPLGGILCSMQRG